MSRPTPGMGVWLALVGVLVLTPDALLLRLSGMDAGQMVAWRGISMGVIFVTAGLALGHTAELRRLWSGAGVTVIVAQIFNATLFATGIAIAPVAIVLLGVATVPVCAAVLAWLLYAEPTSRATWITIALVICGIAIAVGGKSEGATAINGAALLGGLAGIGVALSLAVSFVTLRHHPQVPILFGVGGGALIAGLAALAVTGPARMLDGTLWPIMLTSWLVLPVSFYLLSLAPRYTSAANVSLLLLLETVLAPLWVWWALQETPSLAMLVGGVLVVGSLGGFLWHARTRSPLSP